jgi:uncharacterized membrane protein
MTYARDYLYLFAGGLIVVLASDCLSPLDLAENTMLTILGSFLGIMVGLFLFGRKNL